MDNEVETYRAFFQKYAVGDLTVPSCLVCGQSTPKPKIRHLELSGIVVCERCAHAHRVLSALLDRDITYVGPVAYLPFMTHDQAINHIAEARRYAVDGEADAKR